MQLQHCQKLSNVGSGPEAPHDLFILPPALLHRRRSAPSPTCKFGFLAARARSTKIAASAQFSTLQSGRDSGHWLMAQRGSLRLFTVSGQSGVDCGSVQNDTISREDAFSVLSELPVGTDISVNDDGLDAARFRNALIEMGISPCIPSHAGRKVPIYHDADLYCLRQKIENMFARLKAWRCIATRYDQCPILFLSAYALAATVIYWS